MTAILADCQYFIRDFPEINQLNVGDHIDKETIDKINKIATLVGAPTYQKTPVFKQKQRRLHRPKKNVISADDWEEIRNFKATQLEKKEEGVEKDIDEIRGLLNKLTEANYEDMSKNILCCLSNIIDKNCDREELEKIGKAIFEIGSINKFWSSIYAKLYKTMMTSFPIMVDIYQSNFNSFMELFKTIRHVSAEENYDEFCNVNKENEKRRSMSSFFVHLMNNEVIKVSEIFNIISDLKDMMFVEMAKENKKVEVEEIAENIVILIEQGKDKLDCDLEEKVNMDWESCTEFVEEMASMKPVNYPSLSNKVIFKFMDLEDEL